MKKTLKSLLIAAFCGLSLAFAMTSCSSQVEKAVEEVQADLPMDAGNGCFLTACEIQNDYVDLLMTSDESIMSLDNEYYRQALAAVSEELKEEYVNNADVLKLLKACKQEKMGLRVTMKGTQSGASIVMVDFTPAEIQADNRI